MRIFWTLQEEALIRMHYPDNGTADIMHLFPGRSIAKVQSKASYMKVKKSAAFMQSTASGRISSQNDIGIKTRFAKQCPGWNKGLKQRDYMSPENIEKTKATRFKKGQDPHNTVPLGYERISRDGYIEVKVRHLKNGDANNKNFDAKHRIIYAEKFGPIPENCNVEFLDGDKFNIDPSNLVLRTKKENLLKNSVCDASIVKRFLGVKDPELVEKIISDMPELIELKRNTIKLNQKIKNHAKKSK